MRGRNGEKRRENHFHPREKLRIRHPHKPETIQKMSAVKQAKYEIRISALTAAGEKACKNCTQVKPLSNFYQTKRKQGGLSYSSWCKDCGAAQLKQGRLASCFNLTVAESDTILVYQENCCAICHQPVTAFRRQLAVDHNHLTGLIRGRLCWYCNKLLGIARDNPERLFAALIYILRPPAVEALGKPRFGLPGQAGTKKQKKLKQQIAKNPQVAPIHVFTPVDVADWITTRLRLTLKP